jgi:ATP-binding cassette subfamily C (CFTR/MRP) protein 1
MANPSSEIYKLVNTMGTPSKKEEKDEEESPSLVDDVPDEGEDTISEHEQDAAKIPKMDRRGSIATMRRASVLSTRAAKREAIRDLKEDSRPKERREKGAVNRQVYRDYISAASRFGVASFFLCILGAQATSIAGNLILRHWADVNDTEGGNTDVSRYLTYYGCIGLLSSLLSVAATLLLQVLCGIRCSKQMHDKRYVCVCGLRYGRSTKCNI